MRSSTRTRSPLFEARGADLGAVLEAADELRREVCGDEVSYVVTRNVNYTNVCYFRCGFCAFSKGKLAANLRGKPYVVPLEEIVRRARGAGIAAPSSSASGRSTPVHRGDLPGDLRRRRRRCPTSTSTPSRRSRSGRAQPRSACPLDNTRTAGRRARIAPGHRGRDPRRRSAAHALPGQGHDRPVARGARRGPPCRPPLDDDDHVRLRRGAALVGAPPPGAARTAEAERRFHRVRAAPVRHMEAPIYLKGRARPGPTYREAVLMHAVGRLALHPWITNVQASG